MFVAALVLQQARTASSMVRSTLQSDGFWYFFFSLVNIKTSFYFQSGFLLVAAKGLGAQPGDPAEKRDRRIRLARFHPGVASASVADTEDLAIAADRLRVSFFG
jgi:hypothetical protein